MEQSAKTCSRARYSSGSQNRGRPEAWTWRWISPSPVAENRAIDAGQDGEYRVEQAVQRVDAAKLVHAADVIAPFGPLLQIVAFQDAEDPPRQDHDRRADQRAGEDFHADSGRKNGEERKNKFGVREFIPAFYQYGVRQFIAAIYCRTA